MRANARRAIAAADLRKGAARAVVRKPRAPTYDYDTLKVLIENWTLVGEPCGKYLAPVMADSLASWRPSASSVRCRIGQPRGG